MKEYYFAGYRLLADAGIDRYDTRCLQAFTEPMPYTHTFFLHFGQEADLSHACTEALSWPAVCESSGFRIHRSAEQWAYIIQALVPGKDILLFVSPDYSDMTLYFTCRTDGQSLTGKQFLPLAPIIRCAYESGETIYNGISLHASLVEANGKGVLFLGPSGIGKSTQAKLWSKFLQADFINGDRPCLRWMDGAWYACGMPWDGNDGLLRQKNVPVQALVSLEQAPENIITPLTGQEAMIVMLHQAMLPFWDDAAMAHAMQLTGRVATELPFYHLSCRPDAGAVRLTFDTIFA